MTTSTVVPVVLPRQPKQPKTMQGKLLLSQVGKLTRGHQIRIEDNLKAMRKEITMEGATSLVIDVYDEANALFRSGVLTRTGSDGLPRLAAADIQVSGVWYRLAKLERSDDAITTTITFRDRVLPLLQIHTKPKRASRKRVTRAQFYRSLVLEVRAYEIGWFSPDEDVEQPISKIAATERETSNQRDDRRAPGFADDANIKVKGQAAKPAQQRVLANVIRGCEAEDATRRMTIGAVAVVTQESLAGELPVSSSGQHLGPFHQDASYGPPADRRDAYRAARAFCRRWIQRNGRQADGDLGVLADNVQVSGNPRGFSQWEAEATRTVDAWDGGAETAAASPGRRVKSYRFTRGQPGQRETTHAAIRRGADEVRWRYFIDSNRVHFCSDETLARARALLTLTARDDGVQNLRYGMDIGQPVREVDFTALGREQDIQPGMVIPVRGEGIADRRYLLWNGSIDLITGDVTGTIRLPQRQLPEPAPETADVTVNDSGDRTDTTTGNTGGALADVRPTGEWAGTKAIFDQFVTPFMAEQGLRAGNAKRSPAQNADVGGAADSDHLTTNTRTYAVDYPTTSGEAAARALARELGWSGWAPNSYARHTITVGGRRFVVQILWGADIEHGDHVHVGIRAA